MLRSRVWVASLLFLALPAWAQGAGAGREHWAYRAPVRPGLPEVGDLGWCRTGVDRFVLQGLEARGLAPSPEVGAAGWLRRVSLDLTGLLPTEAEREACLQELGIAQAEPAREAAYERVVERLLASDAHAEHLALEWLDLARYADSNGYEKDDRRVAWRYRDWVIDAFRQHMPFDRFTVEQLAGDLLPGATLEQRIATGFQRNTMVNLEGGTDPEEFRVAAVIDRVNTTASVWLGTTLACAQCHNHKYDPFSQKEYFELFAFFNTTEDTGNSVEPTLAAPLPGQQEAIRAAQGRVEELGAERRALLHARAVAATDWARSARAALAAEPQWARAELSSAHSERGAVLTLGVDQVFRVTGELPDRDAYRLLWSFPQGAQIVGLMLEALREDDAAPIGPGRSSHGNIVLTDLLLGPRSGGERLAWREARATHSQSGFEVQKAIDGDLASGWALANGGELRSEAAVFALTQPLELGPEAELELRLAFESDYARHELGRFRVRFLTREADLEFLALPRELAAALARPAPAPGVSAGAVDPSVDPLVGHFVAWIDPAGRALRERLAGAQRSLEQAEAELPRALVMQEQVEPRTTTRFVRGSFLNPAEELGPGVPAALNPWPTGAPVNRLGLAQWLVAGDNPLTARVTVNRLWARLFGRGLVEPLDDFGTRSEPPTHPELLDWLALELIDSGWSLDHVLRLLVLSSTYRQVSTVSSRALEQDPLNLWLGRMPRLRLDFEALRDVALQAGGLLDRTLGGPSVFPPQPEGIWASTYSNDRWMADLGADRFRRGLYTFLKRTSPYPSAITFDGTSRELACTRRARSNTPLQALTLLNDPAFFEAAAGLGRELAALEATTDERIAWAFRRCLSREPEDQECVLLRGLFAAEQERYSADPEAARALVLDLPLGAGPRPDPAAWAAWTLVANALFNLDEFVTKE